MVSSNPTRTGVIYGLSAYLWWGCAVFYFKAVSYVSAEEVLAHRILWSAVLMVALLAMSRRLIPALKSLRQPRTLLTLFATTIMIAMNWYVFIWAVAHDKVLATSLGYFINPLVNVLLGFVFLKERLRRVQVIAVLLATVGVVFQWVSYGEVPFIAFFLALSFAFYGLLRKQVAVDGVTGMAVESALLAPLAVIYLLYAGHIGNLVFTNLNWTSDFLLMSAGPVTALPLVWFVAASKHLRYSMLGLMMYIMPSMSFLIAVFIFGEPFGVNELISFGCIWLALLIYSIDSLRNPEGRSRRIRVDMVKTNLEKAG